MTTNEQKLELNRNWLSIQEYFIDNYRLLQIYKDDKDNVLALRDSAGNIFVIGYLHALRNDRLIKGNPVALDNEIKIFVDEIKLLCKSNWEFYEIRMILNLHLGELNNSEFKEIPKDVKYFLIDNTTFESGKLTHLKFQDLILESVKSNRITHESIRKSFERIGSHQQFQSKHPWSCSICDGDSETGCLYFDPTECPRI